MMHTGWSSTHCRSWRWHGQIKAIFFWHALPVAPITVARRDLSPLTGTVSQATKTNGIVRLHVVTSIAVSVLVVTIEDDRLFTVDCYP